MRMIADLQALFAIRLTILLHFHTPACGGAQSPTCVLGGSYRRWRMSKTQALRATAMTAGHRSQCECAVLNAGTAELGWLRSL